MRAFVADSLRRTGYEVSLAADGATALGYVHACEKLEASMMPHAIVADVRMPDLDGLELLERVRDTQHSPPVILITAFGDADTHARARRLGAVAMFDKPFDIDDLTRALAKVVPFATQTSSDEIAGVAHDLRNPLALVELGLDAIDRLAQGSDVHIRLRPELDRIHRSTRYMDRLVRDLVELPRVEAGHLVLRRRKLSLAKLVAAAIDLSLANRDRMRVQLAIRDDPEVEVDEARIERVVANLVQNAAKYSPPGTLIHVEVATLAERAIVSVIDAGPGVSADEAMLVFERYQRAAASAGKTGSGLGLYISKRIIEAHGGAVGVERRAIGSRFFFMLPLSRTL
jgi:signal transduction histidine kinase